MTAGIELNENQIESVWRIVDEDQSGTVEYQVIESDWIILDYPIKEFIGVFIGEMPESRVSFVNKAWKKLDPKGNGIADKFDFRKVFSAKNHPAVKSGSKDENQIFESFCRVLEIEENQIRYSKFFEFFLALSLTVQNNDVFINLIQALFGK